MRPLLTTAVTVTTIIAVLVTAAHALGSTSTLAIADGSGTVCGIIAGPGPQSLQCARARGVAQQRAFGLFPNVPIVSVSGGRDFLCGLRSGGTSFFCWNAAIVTNSSASLPAKRVYNGRDSLSELSVGDDQVCAVDNDMAGIRWWRGDGSYPRTHGEFKSLTSGRGFSCAITTNSSVRCWGSRGSKIQSAFANVSVISIVAGDSHMCGVDTSGLLICKGSNDSGQSNAPSGLAFEFSGLALGAHHSCAIRRPNGTVLCWGGAVGGAYTPVNKTSLALIVAGGNLTCGVITTNYSVVCWGADQPNPAVITLPLPRILPGICTRDNSSCSCGPFPGSETLCSGSGVICMPEPCIRTPAPSPQPMPPPSPPPPTSTRTNKGLAFAIIGSVGAFAGICTVVYCIWTGVCRRKKVHNSVQPTIGAPGAANAVTPTGPPGGPTPSPFTSPNGSRSRIFRRQSSRAMMMRRQRSGPSSFKDRAEEFSFDELAAATKNFSLGTKIGAGSFGTVYKGKLPDGREVAIKRSESGPITKKFQEKESAFHSELAFLSRLHHKHLVGLVGFCEEEEERLLVYEYMKNGALYDHLHGKTTDGSDSSKSPVLNSWKMRIKVLLDASRGIEYLHSYAVPPIIHRDIKSSNILLDGNWTARVSDFGLSLMGPEGDGEHVTTQAAGTMGYMDPEYFGLQHLTVKSDVYGLGVVMLEVLTGKRAIFKDKESGNPTSVVDYAMPSIVTGEVARVLDTRVALTGPHEAEAVELVAYTAVHCVSLEGRERPTMTDVVANLDRALALCDGSHSMSTASVSLASVD